jgi:SAM-dependent methyltransferase
MARHPDRRFDPLAPIYARVRPPYPAAVGELLLEAHGGERFACAVDLGCGTGLSLDVLAAIADEVIGVEPADAMRREAEARHPGVCLVRAGAAETGLEDGCAELVTIAAAFHWMDPRAVLAECARLLLPGGLLAIYTYDTARAQGPPGEVLERHMRERWSAFRSPRLDRLHHVPAHLEDCAHFELARVTVLPNPVRWSPAEVTAFERSTSYVGAWLASLGPEGERDYLAQLERELAAAARGPIEMSFDVTLYLARRI